MYHFIMRIFGLVKRLFDAVHVQDKFAEELHNFYMFVLNGPGAKVRYIYMSFILYAVIWSYIIY